MKKRPGKKSETVKNGLDRNRDDNTSINSNVKVKGETGNPVNYREITQVFEAEHPDG